jgi:putative DNA primase/helicase
VITPDLQDGVMPDLSKLEGREVLEELINEYDLIVVDNLSSLVRGGAENEAESWQPIQDWTLDLRRRGKTVLFVHHAGKSGKQRGTSKREDALDVIITLKRPDDYRAEQGARFEVHFEKTRHFAGDDARSFLVQLKDTDDVWDWVVEDIGMEPKIAKVAHMMKEGKTILEMMEIMNLSKSQIETLKKKAAGGKSS